eukprot:751572-Hanusia_phi.AAC.8
MPDYIITQSRNVPHAGLAANNSSRNPPQNGQMEIQRQQTLLPYRMVRTKEPGSIRLEVRRVRLQGDGGSDVEWGMLLPMGLGEFASEKEEETTMLKQWVCVKTREPDG